MDLGSTQPLTEMSTRNLPGGKGRPARGLTTLPPSVSRTSRKRGSLDAVTFFTKQDRNERVGFSSH
jgi:hypothetical protein